MPQFAVLGSFEAHRIPIVVPPDYRERVRSVTRPGITYTVVLFTHDRSRGVVTSAHVRRALAKIPVGERVLAVGSDFTVESTTLLNERDAAIARIGEFGWTDESYNSLPR